MVADVTLPTIVAAKLLSLTADVLLLLLPIVAVTLLTVAVTLTHVPSVVVC